VAQALPVTDRANLLEMAAQWDRLADQQEHATDLRTNTKRPLGPYGRRSNPVSRYPQDQGVAAKFRASASRLGNAESDREWLKIRSGSPAPAMGSASMT